MISLLCNYMMNKSNLERFIKNLILFRLMAEQFLPTYFYFSDENFIPPKYGLEKLLRKNPHQFSVVR